MNIHCRRDQSGTAAGKKEGCQKIVGNAVSEFPDDIRSRRRDDEQGRLTRKLNVHDFAGFRPEFIQINRMLTETLKKYGPDKTRSEEHTSELQSRRDLVCRLLLEKKKKKTKQSKK